MPLQIAMLIPFYTDSHRSWVDGVKKYSRHKITCFTMSGKYWKWRMHGAAVTLARKLDTLTEVDLIVTTDMIDLAVLKGLLPNHLREVPIALYMHENQLTYPWSPTDIDVDLNRDRHYAWINYTSCLAADHIFFNSAYHKKVFTESLQDYLKAFPDYIHLDTITAIQSKSSVLHLGLDWPAEIPRHSANDVPVFLWNHRWEYDKNPMLFFDVLNRLKRDGFEFKLIVAGRSYAKQPPVFNTVERTLGSELIHFGYAESHSDYQQLLSQSDILCVTSNQDFFGLSVVEAIRYGAMPILPDRLAYTDYIDPDIYSHLYYQTDDKLYEKLSLLLKEWPFSYQDISSEVVNFDWTLVIKHYDTSFESIVNGI